MSYKYKSILLVAAFFIAIPAAVATSNDTQQPISIESNHAELDEKKGIGTYMGNVILQQGGIKITADKITVYANKGELQKLIAEGNPVRFTQDRENLENITGSSLRMEYDAESKHFLLINNAELMQGKNRFSGQHIQFDPDQEKVIATGSSDKTGESAQRVQITIQPKKSNEPDDKK